VSWRGISGGKCPGGGIAVGVKGAAVFVVGGLIAVVVVLAAASAAGFAMRRRQGLFRPTSVGRTETAGAGRSASSEGALSAADLGAPLGTQATLVQFSTEVCAYCGPARELLTEVARDRDGVAFVEIDAAERMDLTRRLHVLSTPTVLVLDALGGITSRASGPLRKSALLAAVGAVLDAGDGS
jgi:Thioredoxin